jgi:hypothetical protein
MIAAIGITEPRSAGDRFEGRLISASWQQYSTS